MKAYYEGIATARCGKLSDVVREALWAHIPEEEKAKIIQENLSEQEKGKKNA